MALDVKVSLSAGELVLLRRGLDFIEASCKRQKTAHAHAPEFVTLYDRQLADVVAMRGKLSARES